jgi:hypothetical protein
LSADPTFSVHASLLLDCQNTVNELAFEHRSPVLKIQDQNKNLKLVAVKYCFGDGWLSKGDERLS